MPTAYVLTPSVTVPTVTPSYTVPSNKEERQIQNALYKKYFRKIKGYYVNETHNFRLSEELAHEALYKVLKGLPTFQEGRNMANWVHGVARNNLFDYFRSQKTNKNTINRNTSYVEMYADNEVYTDTNSSDETFIRERLDLILKSFTAVDSLIFQQHIFDGATYEELSETTSLPVDTIKNKLAYMRKKIRNILTNDN